MPNFSKSCITNEDIKLIAEGCIAEALAALPDETYVVDSVIDAEGNLFLIRNDGVQVPVPFVSDFTGINFDNDGLTLDFAEICQRLVADPVCIQAIADAIGVEDDTFAIPSSATSAGTDSFGTTYGAGTTIVTYSNGNVVAHPSTEESLSDQCYEIAQLSPTDCEIMKVGFSKDGEGCGKFVTYTDTERRISIDNSRSVYGDVHSIFIPAQALDGTIDASTVYTRGELLADQNAGTVDRTKLDSNKIWEHTFEIVCDGVYDITFTGFPVFEPIANGGAGRSSLIVLEIDGTFPVTASGTNILAFGDFTNFESKLDDSTPRFFAAGTHTVSGYVIRNGASTEPARLRLAFSSATVGNNNTQILKSIA